ncbi:hypothetical protein ACOL21_07535 [Aliarcobacter butzleri]|uniref:hypothetical protein n=1 Tax=Aliarcobacter butzleri TaxID=28197 RepID=UPI00263DBECE|nr:hypothetical protein [Aliarcobacter butzleri]MDN5086592.1 hypothetical protein [Aliarcobacter butzleri]
MKKLIIYYDGECPFCNEYTKVIKLKSDYKVFIRNARDYNKRMKVYCNQGFDINEGMIVVFDDKVSHGAEAVHLLNKLSTKSTFKEWIIDLFSRNLFFLKYIFYPTVKFIRKVILIIKNKEKF